MEFTIPELSLIEDAVTSAQGNDDLIKSIRAKCAEVLDAEVKRLSREYDKRKVQHTHQWQDRNLGNIYCEGCNTWSTKAKELS